MPHQLLPAAACTPTFPPGVTRGRTRRTAAEKRSMHPDLAALLPSLPGCFSVRNPPKYRDLSGPDHVLLPRALRPWRPGFL